MRRENRRLREDVDILKRATAFLGWATTSHLRTDLVADAPTSAYRQRRPARPVILHSDRGHKSAGQRHQAENFMT
ncbi:MULTISPECIES: hypothetical protein [unclassified Streptomyces]|uniref:hypothetical protein n=1 Tax=unclassified Streptomyces TaxID=2593676 RepID=UPI0038701913